MTPKPLKLARWAMSVLAVSAIAFLFLFATTYVPDSFAEWAGLIAVCLAIGLPIGTAAEWAARRE